MLLQLRQYVLSHELLQLLQGEDPVVFLSRELMAAKGKIPHKVASSDILIARLRPRFSEEPQTNPPLDSEPVLHKGFHVRPGKQRLPDVLAASPYAFSRVHLLPRSMSVAKIPAKVTGHSGVGEKSRTLLAFAKTDAEFRSIHLSEPGTQKAGKDVLNVTTQPKDHQLESSTLSFNSSFSASVQLPLRDSPRRTKKPVSVKSVKGVEIGLAKALREISEDPGLVDADRRQRNAYSQAFTDLIELTPSCRGLLIKIKAKYEEWLHSDRDKAEKSQQDLASLRNSLMKESEEKATFRRKLEKLSKENGELSSACEKFQAKSFEYQQKLFEIANMKLPGFPPTEETWKVLLSQLDTHKSLHISSEKELKTAQSKQRKLLELLRALKSRGFPVEEVYNSDVLPRIISSRSRVSAESSEPVTFEAHPVAPRPQAIPQLQLAAVQDEGDHRSEVPADSYEESIRKALESSASSELTDKCREGRESRRAIAGKLVPKIRIPEAENREEKGFQQEFMAKYQEFSESWRKQIDAQNH